MMRNEEGTTDAERIATLKRLENHVIDLEIAIHDLVADIRTDLEQLKECRKQLAIARQALAGAALEASAT
jgi:hypothetical protein